MLIPLLPRVKRGAPGSLLRYFDSRSWLIDYINYEEILPADYYSDEVMIPLSDVIRKGTYARSFKEFIVRMTIIHCTLFDVHMNDIVVSCYLPNRKTIRANLGNVLYNYRHHRPVNFTVQVSADKDYPRYDYDWAVLTTVRSGILGYGGALKVHIPNTEINFVPEIITIKRGR